MRENKGYYTREFQREASAQPNVILTRLGTLSPLRNAPTEQRKGLQKLVRFLLISCTEARVAQARKAQFVNSETQFIQNSGHCFFFFFFLFISIIHALCPSENIPFHLGLSDLPWKWGTCTYRSPAYRENQ